MTGNEFGVRLAAIINPRSAAEWADLLMAWYEGHTVPSQALRDEIERILDAHARQQVEAFRERAEIYRLALVAIAEGKESIGGLRPEFYGHAIKIAVDALAEAAAK